MSELAARRPLRTPTLHSVGRADRTIPNDFSAAQLDFFAPEAVELQEHPGGHDVPRDERHVNHVADFMLRFVSPTGDAGGLASARGLANPDLTLQERGGV